MTASKRWPEFLRSNDDSEPELPIEHGDEALDLDTLTLGDLHMPGPGGTQYYDDEPEEAADQGGMLHRYLKPIALTVAILLCAATVIFYGYRWLFGGPSGNDLPLVQAIDDPVKVKPESPGGLVVPYKEQLVLNQGTTGTAGEPVVERLLPPPEAPKWPPVSPDTANTAKPEGSASAVGAGKTAAPAGSNSAADGQAAAVPPTGGADATGQTPPALSKPKPTIAKSPAKPAAKEPKTAALATAPAASGGYTLQLISLTSADGAESAWKGMQKQHPDLLGQLPHNVEKATVNGKTYYRVQAGAFNDRGKAQELCTRLKVQKQDCLVLRR